jgi:hypothetical protein
MFTSSATAYSFVAARPAPVPPSDRFQLFHNGMPVEGSLHTTREDAWEQAFELSAQLGTSLRCFRVRKVAP